MADVKHSIHFEGGPDSPTGITFEYIDNKPALNVMTGDSQYGERAHDLNSDELAELITFLTTAAGSLADPE
jgi:N-acetylmuramoyl-L-alanine amidase